MFQVVLVASSCQLSAHLWLAFPSILGLVLSISILPESSASHSMSESSELESSKIALSFPFLYHAHLRLDDWCAMRPCTVRKGCPQAPHIRSSKSSKHSRRFPMSYTAFKSVKNKLFNKKGEQFSIAPVHIPAVMRYFVGRLHVAIP